MTEIPCDRGLLVAELEADEGRRYKRYRCPTGHWTIGVGHNLQSGSLSSDVWRAIKDQYPHVDNAYLDDHVVLTDLIIDRLLDEDISIACASLDAIWIGWRGLSDERKRACINLSFQMGYHRLVGFVRFWRAMRIHAFERAVSELIDSLWYRQTQPSRSSRVIAQIRPKEGT